MPFWRLYYHFVWGTKNRLPLITPALEADLYRAMAAKVKEMGGIVHAIGGAEDHTHVAASVPPKLALAKFVGDVKGNTSHYVNHILRPDFEFYWQDDYGVFSFGEKSLAMVVRYIHEQKQHHAAGTLFDLMERMNEQG